MMSVFKPWKLRRVAAELTDRIASEAWKGLPRICEESEKAAEVLRSTKEGDRVWEGLSVLIGFGVHVVDHYARNFLDQRDRNQLVRRIVSGFLWESEKTSMGLAANYGKTISMKELARHRESLLKLIGYTIDKLEQCQLMHQGLEYGGHPSLTSLSTCGALLMIVFTRECAMPQAKLDTWEEMEPMTLKLYDVARAVCMDVHERVKEHLYKMLQTEGFEQVRDLGTELRVP